ncbi:hypothetical protein HY994_00250 [Candidatus Micrarchaeota archaeon]|nr:hypothetical protein [Candidatus Micrarchaeota archaeon]
MLRCPKCNGQKIQTNSHSITPPLFRSCQSCGHIGPDSAFQTTKTGALTRAEKHLLHSAYWSRRHMRHPPVLNRMDELLVGLASLLLGPFSLLFFPVPGSVPAMVWALTISAFVFLVLFVAAHIWKAHAKGQGARKGAFNPSYAGAPASAKTIAARARRGKSTKTGKKKKRRR